MATPRKRWFRVPDSVGAEPWSNDVLATLIRLQAHLNTRWARDGKEGVESGRTIVRPGDLMALTGCSSLMRARRVLYACAKRVTLTVSEHDENTAIEWRKWPFFQQLVSEPGAISGLRVNGDGSRSMPPPRPSPASRVPLPLEERSSSKTQKSEPASPSPPLVNFLAKEPGSPEAKRDFAERMEPILTAEARAEHPRDAQARSAKLQSLTIRYWRQEQRNPGGPRAPNGSGAAELQRWAKGDT